MIRNPNPLNSSPFPPPCTVRLFGSWFSATNRHPNTPPGLMKQVWFSWQIDVDEFSIQLSQPTPPPLPLPPPPRRRMGKVAPGPSPSPPPPPSASHAQEGGGGGVPLRPVPPSGPHTGDAQESELGGRFGGAGTVVLLLVVSGARARVGIRTEKGFVMHGSVHAVEGSGVGGTTCLSISPAALWGRGRGREGSDLGVGGGAGESMGFGEEGACATNIAVIGGRSD